MKNEIEVIDGVRGEWRTVTKPEEVKVGQMVRYVCSGGEKLGFSDNRRTMLEDGQSSGRSTLFKDGRVSRFIREVQAFFPFSDKPKRKVAKVTISYDWDDKGQTMFHFFVKMSRLHFVITPEFGGVHYSSKESAIRGARRFCKAFGYEMELVK